MQLLLRETGLSARTFYRHFADKESLLTVVATEAWSEVCDALEVLASSSDASPEKALRRALVSLVTIGRSRPHLYRLMFTTPAGTSLVSSTW